MKFWNRREAYTGFSEAAFLAARNTLVEQGIGYDVRTVSRITPQRDSLMTRGAAPFVDHDSTCQYYIYVDKKDYETARYLLRR